MTTRALRLGSAAAPRAMRLERVEKAAETGQQAFRNAAPTQAASPQCRSAAPPVALGMQAPDPAGERGHDGGDCQAAHLLQQSAALGARCHQRRQPRRARGILTRPSPAAGCCCGALALWASARARRMALPSLLRLLAQAQSRPRPPGCWLPLLRARPGACTPRGSAARCRASRPTQTPAVAPRGPPSRCKSASAHPPAPGGWKRSGAEVGRV